MQDGGLTEVSHALPCRPLRSALRIVAGVAVHAVCTARALRHQQHLRRAADSVGVTLPQHPPVRIEIG